MIVDFKNLNISNAPNFVTKTLGGLMRKRRDKLEIHNVVDNNRKGLVSAFSNCACTHVKFVNCAFNKATDVRSLFGGSWGLKTIDIEYSDSQDGVILKMNGMFPNVLKANTAFEGCKDLEHANISDMFKSGTLLSAHGLFNKCEKLKYINIENIRFNIIKQNELPDIHLCGSLQKLIHVDRKQLAYGSNKTVADLERYSALANIIYFEGVTIRLPNDTTSRRVIFHKFDDEYLENMGVLIEK